MSETVATPTAPICPLVLVVDDDPAVLEALSTLLAPRLEPLYRVETAASAEEALDLVASSADAAAQRPVALVISDEKMPGQSGTDLLIALRQHEAHRDGGRIVITAYAGLASAKKAINEAEVDRYFPKPWDAEGALLPAVGEILDRFAEKRGLDRFLIAGAAEDLGGIEAVHEVRRAWWEYVMLMGEDAEEADVDLPPLSESEDDAAQMFLAQRLSPRDDLPAGTIRLRKAEERWLLDGLAFMPEDAGDATETLLLRTALLHAARSGVDEVSIDAPMLRREVCEALGFAPTAGAAEGKLGSVPMAVRPAALASAGEAFAGRFKRDQRLCACAQTSCPERDYAAERRGYFCPFDLREGRVPQGFPARRNR
jgi:CheY-like chemotaxis protein